MLEIFKRGTSTSMSYKVVKQAGKEKILNHILYMHIAMGNRHRVMIGPRRAKTPAMARNQGLNTPPLPDIFSLQNGKE